MPLFNFSVQYLWNIDEIDMIRYDIGWVKYKTNTKKIRKKCTTLVILILLWYGCAHVWVEWSGVCLHKVERREESVVLVKINEMALKVSSHKCWPFFKPQIFLPFILFPHIFFTKIFLDQNLFWTPNPKTFCENFFQLKFIYLISF